MRVISLVLGNSLRPRAKSRPLLRDVVESFRSLSCYRVRVAFLSDRDLGFSAKDDLAFLTS